MYYPRVINKKYVLQIITLNLIKIKVVGFSIPDQKYQILNTSSAFKSFDSQLVI